MKTIRIMTIVVLMTALCFSCSDMIDSMARVRLSVTIYDHDIPLDSRFTVSGTREGSDDQVYRELGTISEVVLLPLQPGRWTLSVQARVDNVLKGEGTVTVTVKPGEEVPAVVNMAYRYMVSFDSDGGSNPSIAGKDVVYDSAYGPLAVATKTGYTLEGWYTERQGAGTRILESTLVSVVANQILYANWTPNTYEVEFDTQLGTGGTSTTIATYDAAMPASLSAPSKNGYSFQGYFDQPSGTGNQYYDAEMESTATWDKAQDTVLYAKWTAQVSFDSQSATTASNPATKTVVYTAGTDTIDALPTAPVRTGYTFRGWWTETSGGGTEFTSATEVTGNITVYAKWVSAVSFDGQGATTAADPISKDVVKTGGTDTLGTLPTAPQKTGYSFGGWWTAVSGGGTQVDAGTVVDGNVTYYAKWTAQVSFDSQSATTASDPATKTVIYTAGTDTVDALPTAPQRTNYTFRGWWTAINGGGTEFTSATEVTGNVTVYAKWVSVVSFDGQGATTAADPISKDVVKTGGTDTLGTLPTAPQKTGYAFGGWWTIPSGGGTQIDADTVVDGNVTYYAKWTAQVSFDSQSATTASNPATKTVVYTAGTDTVDALPIAPQKTGYSFGGWWTETSGGGSEFTASTAVTGDITVYAKWTAQVSFDSQSATTASNPATKTVVYTAGTDTIDALPTPPQRTNYTFRGWWTETSGGGTEFTSATEVTGNITVYAKWVSVVGFDGQGATTAADPISKDVVKTGGTDTLGTLPTAPQKTGYTFGGWWTAVSGGGTQVDADTVVDGNVTYYAKWSAQVSFDSQNATTASDPETKTVVYTAGTDTVDALPTAPVRTGYTFRGWWTAINGGGTEFSASTQVTGDITVYAKWVSVVSFDGQGATTAADPSSRDVVKTGGTDTLGTLPTAPQKTGYSFGGWWTIASGGGIQVDADTVVDGNVTYYAKWTARVSFDSQGATTAADPSSKDVIKTGGTDTLGTLPTAPQKSGYTFGGWWTEASGGGSEFTAFTAVTGDITVYAKWTAQVSFDDQGATTAVDPVFKTVVYSAGTDTVDALPTAPVRTGYTFRGWWTATNGGGTQFIASTEVAGDITVYAKWVSVVSFDGQGAATAADPSSKDVIKTDGIDTLGTLPTAPQKTGYTFGGWWTAVSGGGTQVDADTVVDGNVTCYAKWSAQVSFDDQGATTAVDPVFKTVLYTAGTDTVDALPTAPERTGYTFRGWWTEAGGGGSEFTAFTAVTGDITVYAKWTAQVNFDSQAATTDAEPSYKQVVDNTSGSDTVDSLPTNPSLTNYSFAGWWTAESGGGTEFTASTEVTGDVTVYAKWVSKVTFDNLSATTQSDPISKDVTKTVGADTVGQLPTEPLRNGYAFAGWWTQSSGGGTQVLDTTIVNGNMTVYPKWVATVTFDSQGATVQANPQTKQVVYTSGIDTVDSLPTEPTKTNYTFGGWWTGTTGTGTRFEASTEVTGNLKVYALWYPDRTVTFQSNGGSLVPTMTNVPHGSKISAPTAPVKSGKILVGWYKESSLTNQWNFDSDTVTANITLYARWRDYQVKDIGPAGGYIFYDKGWVSDGWRYMEAAPASTQFGAMWWGDAVDILPTETGIGTGEENTQAVIDSLGNWNGGNYPAKKCQDLVVVNNGVTYDDWFLPSKDELDMMHDVLWYTPYYEYLGLGGFGDEVFWSSSEASNPDNPSYPNSYAWAENFTGGGPVFLLLRHYDNVYTRAARTF